MAKPTQTFFSDFTNSFAKNPFSNDIALIKNERDINQSLRNLILTNFGERFFQPTVGSGILTLLFAPSAEPASIALAETYIENTVKAWEPRVNLLEVTVTLGEDQNTINIIIVYTYIAAPTTPQIFAMLLQRNR